MARDGYASKEKLDSIGRRINMSNASDLERSFAAGSGGDIRLSAESAEAVTVDPAFE